MNRFTFIIFCGLFFSALSIKEYIACIYVLMCAYNVYIFENNNRLEK